MKQNAISIQSLKKTYPNGFEALKWIDLEIKKGSFFALLGPNGAGKSTTISILSGLIKKTSGTAEIMGIEIDSDPSAAKSLIGIVPQEFNFSIFESVETIVVNQAGFYGVPRDQALLSAEKYLKALGLWEKRKDASRTLSWGMKRRLMIARALVHEPEILILDEPTAGVDIELRRGMWDFLREINSQGRTIILTTHYLEEAEALCDMVAIVNKGHIVEIGKMSDVLTTADETRYLVDFSADITESILGEFKDFWPLKKSEKTLDIACTKDSPLTAFFAAAHSNNREVISIRPSENRLEALFLKMTKGG